MDNRKVWAIIFAVLVMLSLMLLMMYLSTYLCLELQRVQWELERVQRMLQEQSEREIEINLQIEDIFPGSKETSMVVTAYAPFDTQAVAGMCYSGNPSITASGEAPVPGETVAAVLPFGTVLYIEGIGLRRVNDRGVGAGRLDVVTATRSQALKIGRSRRRVIMLGVMG